MITLFYQPAVVNESSSNGGIASPRPQSSDNGALLPAITLNKVTPTLEVGWWQVGQISSAIVSGVVLTTLQITCPDIAGIQDIDFGDRIKITDFFQTKEAILYISSIQWISADTAILTFAANTTSPYDFDELSYVSIQETGGGSVDGYVVYRKVFISKEVELCPKIHLCAPSQADDFLQIHIGTDADDQSDAELYTAWKGTGTIKENISEGTELVTLSITPAAYGSDLNACGFSPLDLVRISSNVSVREEDYARIKTVSWNGSDLLLTFFSNIIMNYSYQIGDSISACIERGKMVRSSVWIKEFIPMNSRTLLNSENILRVVV